MFSHSTGDLTDQKTIALINTGDQRAFERLYHRHRDWVFRMARRIIGCDYLAEDVLQEVFCYFLSKFPGFELRCELRTFLYPVIRNLALSSLRSQKRFVGGESGATVIDQLTAPDDDFSGCGDIEQIIARLGSEHREILLLRFVDGMTLPEIATMVDIPLGTAKSRLHHALAALRSSPKVRILFVSLNDSSIKSA